MRRTTMNTRILATALLLYLAAEVRAGEVVAVVAADNPVETISPNELTNIFLGKASHFPGGGPAQPVDQQEGAPAREAFYQKYTGQSTAQIKAYWAKMIFTGRGRPPRTLPNGEAVRQWVADYPDAIGYLDERWVDDSVKVLRVE